MSLNKVAGLVGVARPDRFALRIRLFRARRIFPSYSFGYFPRTGTRHAIIRQSIRIVMEESEKTGSWRKYTLDFDFDWAFCFPISDHVTILLGILPFKF